MALRAGRCFALQERNDMYGTRLYSFPSFAANADYVAAINILGRGLKMLKGQDTADASAGCESTARIACEVNGEVRPSAAGTDRNGRLAAIVGIPFLHGAGGCQRIRNRD
jgi:hypothetical protein